MEENKLTKKERKLLKKQAKEEQKIVQESKRRFWRNMGIIAAIIVIIALGVAAKAILSQEPEKVASLENDPVKGSPDAKVLIREYSDFQCPACRNSALALSRVLEEYGDDEVAFVYNDLPLIELHPNAYEASLAVECAFEQDKFWPYHDRLFLDQEAWKDLEDPRDQFIAYADAFDLDIESFTLCLEEERYKQRVEEDINEARSLKMNSTPTYFINGVRYVGGRPEDDWREVIDSFLK